MAGRFRGVTQRGQGWQISFTLPDGTRCREQLRLPQTRKGEEQAAGFRARIIADIDLGGFDYAKYFPRSKNALARSSRPAKHTSVEIALRQYFSQGKRRLATSTYRDYECRIFSHLIPSFGQTSLADLSPSMVRDWIAQSTLSAKAINNILIRLREICRDAYENELLDRDPMSRVRALPVTAREPDPFSQEEIVKILRSLAARSVIVKDYFQFAFSTGLRTSELIAVTWADIDMVATTLTVSCARVRALQKSPKTSSGRRIVDLRPCATAALDSQARRRQAAGEVFYDPRTGRSWKDDQALRKVYWYPTLRALGIRQRNPYQTRHTFASHLLSRGENPLYVAAQMGHRDWGMIRKVYGRYIRQ